MSASPCREQVLAELRREIGGGSFSPPARPQRHESGQRSSAPSAPSALSAAPDRGVLPVLEPLADLLPQGGLPRGGIVCVVDQGHSPQSGGASSLLLSLLAAPVPRWSAVVGMPNLGWAAAAELGVDLERLVLIPDPGPDVLQVLSVLIDGVDLIAVAAPRGQGGSPARLRILAGRLRQHGAVLLVAGQWPGADLVLSARHTGWVGLGRGTGRLRDRELTITVGGRRIGRVGPAHTVLLSGRRDGSVALQSNGRAAEVPVLIPAAM